MRRREVITLLGGAAAAWPFVAVAQNKQRVRRVAVLMMYPAGDSAGDVRADAFRKALELLGWTPGRNVQIDFLWGRGDANWIKFTVNEALKSPPDVIVVNGGETLVPIQQVTQTVPTIFIGSSDPVRQGLIKSLARPGGNITGFTTLEPTVGAKLLELLKEVTPTVNRAVFLLNPENPGTQQLFEAATAEGRKLGVEIMTFPVRGAPDVSAAYAAEANRPNVGFVVPPDPLTNGHSQTIIELALRHRIPAIYALRAAAVEGGLMSYGIDVPDLFRKAAGYTDRILRGAKPGALPVQQPTRFELAINIRTAKVLGIAVPATILARADEVIE